MLARSLRRVYAFGPFVRGQRENIPRARQRACGECHWKRQVCRRRTGRLLWGAMRSLSETTTLTHEDADTAASVQQVCNQARG